MVAFNSWNALFQSPKLPHFFFIFLLFPHSTPLSFNLPDITTVHQNSYIKTYPEAYISSQGLQVTPDERGQDQRQRAGRATYAQPLHLWGNASEKLADFATHFSFVIDSSGSSNHADGLAFFLVPNVSDIQVMPGSSLGLPINSTTLNFSSPFVAVEFDTFTNQNLDPNFTHVGININSMKSVMTSRWDGNIAGGAENEAWITYDSNTKNLSVSFTTFVNNTRVWRNNLSYTVDLRDYLPEWVDFGFSASTGNSFEKHNVKSWNFSSSDLVSMTPAASPDPSIPMPRQKKGNKTALVVGLTVGSSVVVGGLGLFAITWWKKRRGGEEKDEFVVDLAMDDEFVKGIGPKKFSYNELAQSTNNFTEEQKLGEGGFGAVYRGYSKELASYVAVKRVAKGSKQGLKEYASEVKIISRIRHRNLVQLIGWCHEKNELLLVYELMPNGSLDSQLFKGKSLLTWAMRYKIVQGLASALLYLHEEWEQCVLHRDIKSSNIMLDANFNAKLGDFGLARLVDHERGSQTTVLAGTMGYMAPECVMTGRASKESDVYSFGIVALEIACGRKPIDVRAEESQARMVEWVWELYGTQKLLEAADPKLSADFDEQEMECLMIVGLWCAHPDYNLRPSIRQAIQVLNLEAPLPILPSKMPVPSYFVTPSSVSSKSTISDSSQSQPHHSNSTYSTDSSKFTASSAASSQSTSLLHPRVS